jgi:hypothetical protein
MEERSRRVLRVRQSMLLHEAAEKLEAAAVCARQMRDPKEADAILHVRGHIGELEIAVSAHVVRNAADVVMEEVNGI